MRKTIMALAAATSLAAALPAVAEMTGGQQTYDLLFRSGTLDGLPRDAALIYDRHVTNSYVPAAEERDSGRVELEFGGGEPERATLMFRNDQNKHRSLGAFPASVGNPIIMFFVETVVRDMAESAGGSPFYIRNRVKEALIQPAEITGEAVPFDGRDVAARAVTLRPFADDPNAPAMQGFGDLEITVTMSDEIPGWYQKLEAVVPGEDGAPRYASTLSLASHGKVE